MRVNSTQIQNKLIHRIEVSLDVGLPNMCTVVLNNRDRDFSVDISPPHELEVAFGALIVFRGKVINRGATYSVRGETTLDIRAFCRLHDMTRKKVTRTFQGATDGDIAASLAAKHRMTPRVEDAPKLQHDHILQRDLTDLAFLLERAARAHCEVISQSGELIFRTRDLQPRGDRLLLKLATSSTGVHVDPEGPPDQVSLQSFKATVNSTAPLVECRVAAWDPHKAEPIVGIASKEKDLAAQLGARSAVAMARLIVPDSIAHFEEPFDTLEEATLFAKSLFNDAALGYITAEAQCKGDPRLFPGSIVDVEVDDELFDGPYYVRSVRHTYQHHGSGKGGYRTYLGLCRNGEGRPPKGDEGDH